MKKSKASIQTIFYNNILAVTIFVFIIAFIAIVAIILNDSVNVLKKTRLDVLSQIMERNKIVTNAIQFLADDIYDECAPELIRSDPADYDRLRDDILDKVYRDSDMLEKLSMSPSVIILMKNGYAITSEDVKTADLSQISSSYWYIDNLTAPQESFWSTRYYISEQESNMEICFVKSILNPDNQYIGIIIASVSTDYLKKAYMSMLGDGYRIYIIDEQGKAISHSIPTLLGCGLYYMPYFWEKYQPDTSTFDRNNIEMMLHTNVTSPEIGWTIVEEIPIRTLIGGFSNVFGIAGVSFVVCVMVSIAVSHLLSKRISRPIVTMSEQMLANEFGSIDRQTAYKEVQVLSNIYNLTVNKINDLIEQIKRDEREKRRLELSFLQAQINPHFLHNTLFTIKCLIEMNRSDNAGEMLGDLIKLLKMPITVDMEWIKIEDEVIYLKSYLSLMMKRYEDYNIVMNFSIEPSLNSVLIPRLILQPIVENSIFHGFNGQRKNALIHISFHMLGEKLIIRIQDNGKGMTKDELDSLWQKSTRNTKPFNSIGLINIKQRIKLLYGEDCGISVVSEPGQGTETILTVRYKKEEIGDGENNGG